VNNDCWYIKGIVDRCSSDSSVRSVMHKVNTMLIFFCFCLFVFFLFFFIYLFIEEIYSSTVKIVF